MKMLKLNGIPLLRWMPVYVLFLGVTHYTPPSQVAPFSSLGYMTLLTYWGFFLAFSYRLLLIFLSQLIIYRTSVRSVPILPILPTFSELASSVTLTLLPLVWEFSFGLFWLPHGSVSFLLSTYVVMRLSWTEWGFRTDILHFLFFASRIDFYAE